MATRLELAATIVALTTLRLRAVPTDSAVLLQTVREVEREGPALKKVHYDEEAEKKACVCLPWKDAYTKYNYTCGEGRELATAGGMQGKEQIGEEFCSRFFERMTGNFCTNSGVTAFPSQWCYTGPDCHTRNGAEPKFGGTGEEHGLLRWKICQLHEDELLRKKTVGEVGTLAKEQGVDVGLLLRMSFPVLERGVTWPDARPFYFPEEGVILPLSMDEEKQSLLSRWKRSRKTHVVPSKDGRPPFAVIKSDAVWIVQESAPLKDEAAAGRGPLQQPGFISEVMCVKGCEKDATKGSVSEKEVYVGPKVSME